MFAHLVGLVLLPLASIVNAGPLQVAGKDHAQLYSSPTCYTRIGSSPPRGKCQTSWSTSYHCCTSTRTSISTVTAQQSTVTTTSTVLTTSTSTGPATTDTATSVTTITQTSTYISVTTTIVIVPSTSFSLLASTVAAPAGFVPIQTSLPGVTYSGGSGGSPAAKREEAQSPAKRSTKALLPKNMKKSFPQAVRCVSHTQKPTCSTIVKTSVTTVSATSHPTKTVTSTSTVVVQSIPTADTTITETMMQTMTISSTSTTTGTSTSVIVVPSVTSTNYAACATSNFGDDYNNHYFDGFRIQFGDQVDSITTIESAYDCCVAAFTDPNGAALVWGYLPFEGCFIAYTSGAVCAANRQTRTSNLVAQYDGTQGFSADSYTLGNGCLGKFTTAENNVNVGQ